MKNALKDGDRLPVLYRSFDIERADVQTEDRTVDVSFSSELPVERFGWIEVLDHRPRSVRLGRLNGGAPVLVNHDPSDQVGVVEQGKVDSVSRRGRAKIRFGKSGRAEEIYQDVQDGIRRSVSVGYRVYSMKLEKSKDGEPDTYRSDDWEPIEISIASVPADPTVGVGRTSDDDLNPVVVRAEDEGPIDDERGKRTMDQENRTIDPQAPAAPAAPAVPAAPAPAIETPRGPDREKAERDRVDRILGIAAKYGQADLGRDFIRNGKSAEDFGAAVLDRIGEAAAIGGRPIPDPRIGMNSREIQRYSLVKAINAFANPNDPKSRSAAAFEMECSDALLKKEGRDLRGNAAFSVPGDVLMAGMGRRDLVIGTTTATGGGALVDYLVDGGSFIDVLRQKLAMQALGATFLTGLTGKISIPRKSTAITAYWVDENAATTEGSAVIDQITLSGYTVAAYQDFGRRLLNQASLDVEAMVRGDIAGSIAVGIDAAVINGTSTAYQPNGLLNTTAIGTTTLGANGAALTWAGIVGLEYVVGTGNGDIGSLAYLTNSKQRQAMKTTVKGTTGSLGFIWDPGPTPVNGYPCFVTQNVPNNLTKGTTSTCSAVIFGNFAEAIVAMWAGLDILVDPYTGSNAGTVRVVGLMDVDAAFRHAGSFAVIKDAL
jgi:HK97 family phage major capsid protein